MKDNTKRFSKRVGDYVKYRPSYPRDAIESFYDRDYTLRKFGNFQMLDWDGLLGRLSSSSYTPLPNTPEYARIKEKMKAAFDRHSVDGMIRFDYETEIYSGRFNG